MTLVDRLMEAQTEELHGHAAVELGRLIGDAADEITRLRQRCAELSAENERQAQRITELEQRVYELQDALDITTANQYMDRRELNSLRAENERLKNAGNNLFELLSDDRECFYECSTVDGEFDVSGDKEIIDRYDAALGAWRAATKPESEAAK